MKHTPTPWSIEDPMGDDLWIVEANKEAYEWRCIASVQATPPDEGPELSRAEMRANAAFIIKSVNNHEALVKALEKIAAMDPWGKRADDLGRAAQVARHAINAVSEEARHG